MRRDQTDLVIGITPFGRPDPAVVVGLVRAGALGVLDLGADPDGAREALDEVVRWTDGTFGVRVGARLDIDPGVLPGRVSTVVVDGPDAVSRWSGPGRRVLVEVRHRAEAATAVAAGADGLVAKGSESGGRIGDLTTFVLLQHLVAAHDLPVWASGGIGLHTVAAAVAGGAAGAVVDAQLALVRESTLPEEIKRAVSTMDGSETVVVGGHRVFTRPDLPVAAIEDAIAADDVADRLGADDLRTQFLPVGQDGAFAAPLAKRFGTAGGLVQGLRRAVDDHIDAAAAAPPLAEGNGLAQALGTRYPIAQGPMTRVSDRAEFAAAVAAGGGLPFLALALMSGPDVRALLEATAELLGDRPWGVGILGFVPPEIREAQLEVVHDVEPPVALIAGGRPSQAAPLEAVGIRTYLHVPSPGLLDLFLKEGARRFVFEGRECGGHVGPRSSFALWEPQIERVLACDDIGDVDVLFAGGVHDARSAAMVGAMSAPLAAAGAGVGVLMGSSYLFTEEAVAGGAILTGFQEAALDCDETVLLETSPGHATRCVDSTYVSAFEAERARLAAEGVPAQEAWAELEQLNLGRLRIATKGVRREGDEIVEVDEDEQRREGMFMIGQAATLRHEVTTVAELHEDVSGGSTRLLEAMPRRSVIEPSPARPLDIAIIGMASVFPGSTDSAEYWANLVGGVNLITEVPAERWDPDVYYDADAFRTDAGRRTPSKWGGFLPEVAFDALEYGIPPSSLAAIEPAQLLSLEVAARALADAGYAERDFDRSRTSVVFGAEGGTDLSSAYGFRALFQTYVGALPDGLEEHLPALTEDSFPGLLTNVIAGRIANRLDLGGTNYTVDAACASALAAMDTATKELVAGTSDMVLCGGADLHNGINDYLLFASVHALSPSGQCHTFDAESDGITLGEGVACVALKRLADAERDGDRIYGVLRGMAGSSDGRHLGLTAPRKEGQRLALDRAYGQAGISPADVGLIEAHGTGTVVGDRTELATLTEVFGEAGAEAGLTSLGSVKSQIGHTKCAAGVAGLIKATEAVYRGVRPATLNITRPNDYHDADTSPFRFDDAPRPWPEDGRIAGVSAFGFGGTNFHAVVSSYDGAPGPEHGLDQWPAELFLFRAETPEQAGQDMADLARRIDGAPSTAPPRLRDLAAAQHRAGRGPVQVAIVAEDLDDLRSKLAAGTDAGAAAADEGVFVADGLSVADDDGDAVAFLHPGQGSQRPGMLRDLFVAFPGLQRHLQAGADYVDTMFPPGAYSREDRAAQKAAITDTRVAQPTLGIAGRAVHDLLAQVGVRPAMSGGHSYGELVALAAAGALDEDDLLPLSRRRAESILAAAGDDPGAMAAVRATADEVRAVLGDGSDVVVANDNAPGQVVVSGPTDALDGAVTQLTEAGLATTKLPVACAFHSPVVAAATQTLADALDELDVHAPAIPVWSNTVAAPYPPDPAEIRRLLAEQVGAPVRFAEQVEAMYEAGARVFVEAGPGRVLAGLVDQILGDRPHVAVPVDVAGEPGLRRFLLALAELAVHGVPVDLDRLYRGRDADPDRAFSSDRAPGWLVNGSLVRTADGTPVAGGLQPVSAAPPVSLAASTAASGERDGTVLEYLRGARELMAAEREVMLRYLGGPVEPLRAPGPVPVGDTAPVAAVEAPAADPGEADTASGGRLSAEEVLDAVLAIVAERTGYPPDMLDPDLDLEADLSIDSIKRIEIVGELADRVGLPGADEGAIDESVVEELAQLKTLRGIVEWIDTLEEREAGGSTADAASPGLPAEDRAAPEIPPTARRYVVEVVEAEPRPVPPADRDLTGRRFAVVDDSRGIGLHLTTLLEARGAEVRVVDPSDDVSGVDGLVHLGFLAPGSELSVPELFVQVQAALVGGATELLVATGLGGRFGVPAGPDTAAVEAESPDDAGVGAGAHGLARTAAAEFPQCRVRAVDLDLKDDPTRLAEHLLAELWSDAPAVEAGYTNGTRHQIRLRADEPSDTGSGPVLDAESVVLLTGGARGITARVAVELAQRHGCRIELLGRSPLPPDEEDPSTAAAEDAPALRRALAERDGAVPATIEAECARILADREIRATLAAVREAGGEVRYHRADVRDAAAVETVMADVADRYGRLDGVIHGAGVLEDRFLKDKTRDSFERVFATKVEGAQTLVAAAPPSLRFLVLFASVSGVFGNRGQIDYSAANDALDTLARRRSGRPGPRVVSVDWGPWAGTGMVSAELEREYARRGIGLIDPDDGVDRLLAEVARPTGDPQVVLMRATPDDMHG